MCSRWSGLALAGVVLLLGAGCRDLVVPNEVVEGNEAPVVRGRIFGPDGEPLAFTRVWARNRGHLPHWAPPSAVVEWDGSTDEDGYFDSGLLSRGIAVDIEVDPPGTVLPSFTWRELPVPRDGLEVRYFPNNLRGEVRVTVDGLPSSFDRLDVGAYGVFAGRPQFLETHLQGTTRYLLPIPVQEVELHLDLNWNSNQVDLDWLQDHMVDPDVEHDLEVAFSGFPIALSAGGEPLEDGRMVLGVRGQTDEIEQRSTEYADALDGIVTARVLTGSRGRIFVDGLNYTFHLPREFEFDQGAGQAPLPLDLGRHVVTVEVEGPDGERSVASRFALENLHGDLLGNLQPRGDGTVCLPTGHYQFFASPADGSGVAERFIDSTATVVLRAR